MDTGAAEVERQLAVIKAQMPETYKSIQAKAGEIGKRAFALVRRGLRGEVNCFWACERGHVVGTPFSEDTGIMADVARVMVSFGCSFVAIWPKEDAPDGAFRTHASYQPGQVMHGSH